MKAENHAVFLSVWVLSQGHIMEHSVCLTVPSRAPPPTGCQKAEDGVEHTFNPSILEAEAGRLSV